MPPPPPPPARGNASASIAAESPSETPPLRKPWSPPRLEKILVDAVGYGHPLPPMSDGTTPGTGQHYS